MLHQYYYNVIYYYELKKLLQNFIIMDFKEKINKI